jgi:hypothetical protein
MFLEPAIDLTDLVDLKPVIMQDDKVAQHQATLNQII